jgi:hypothetical protein
MDLREIGCEVVDWIQVAQHRTHWQALVDTTVKFGLHERLGIYLPAEQPTASKDGRFSM